MTKKMWLKNVLKTSNQPKVEGAISFKESFNLNKVSSEKPVVSQGKFKSLQSLGVYSN